MLTSAFDNQINFPPLFPPGEQTCIVNPLLLFHRVINRIRVLLNRNNVVMLLLYTNLLPHLLSCYDLGKRGKRIPSPANNRPTKPFLLGHKGVDRQTLLKILLLLFFCCEVLCLFSFYCWAFIIQKSKKKQNRKERCIACSEYNG